LLFSFVQCLNGATFEWQAVTDQLAAKAEGWCECVCVCLSAKAGGCQPRANRSGESLMPRMPRRCWGNDQLSIHRSSVTAGVQPIHHGSELGKPLEHMLTPQSVSRVTKAIQGRIGIKLSPAGSSWLGINMHHHSLSALDFISQTGSAVVGHSVMVDGVTGERTEKKAADVISPDNGLVKAGILRAPAPFDCVGQLWRNGHYLPLSGSIKKPPCPSYPCVRVPTGGGTWAVYPTSRGKEARWAHRRGGIHSYSLLSFGPELPSPLAPPPIMCPDGRARGPNEPFGTERKEGASYSCDVGVVVPFNAFAMATGPRPWKHAAPLS
ncbi:hypothetical protein F7725_019468, partial [Dissostichus mawsoni]